MAQVGYNHMCLSPLLGKKKMKSEVNIVDKRWGREIWFANNEEKDYCGKILEINPNNQLSLHFHMIKEEHLYNMSGDCKITWLNQSGSEFKIDLQEGQSFHIKPGVIHRFSTEGGCTLLEASTFHRNSDSYRVVE